MNDELRHGKASSNLEAVKNPAATLSAAPTSISINYAENSFTEMEIIRKDDQRTKNMSVNILSDSKVIMTEAGSSAMLNNQYTEQPYPTVKHEASFSSSINTTVESAVLERDSVDESTKVQYRNVYKPYFNSSESSAAPLYPSTSQIGSEYDRADNSNTIEPKVSHLNSSNGNSICNQNDMEISTVNQTTVDAVSTPGLSSDTNFSSTLESTSSFLSATNIENAQNSEGVNYSKDIDLKMGVDHSEAENEENVEGEDNGTDLYEISSSSTDPNSQCKILTKYIFINQPKTKKAKKKRLGVLYKQAFRHFQKSKASTKMSFGKLINMISKSQHTNKKKNDSKISTSGKNDSKKSTSGKNDSKKSTSGKRKRKTDAVRDEPKPKREKKKPTKADKATESKKKPVICANTKTTKKQKPKGKKNIIKKKDADKETVPSLIMTADAMTDEISYSVSSRGRKIAIRKAKQEPEMIPSLMSDLESDDEEEWNYSGKVKKGKRKKYLSLADKVEIIELLQGPSSSVATVFNKYNVSKSTVDAIVKEKDDILAKAEDMRQRKRQRTKKTSRRTKSKKTQIKIDHSEKVHAKKAPKVLEIKEEVVSNDDYYNRDYGDDNVESEGTDSNINALKGEIKDCSVNLTGISNSTRAKNGLKIRKEVTLAEKVKIIHALENPGAKIRHVAKMFGLSSSAVSRMNKFKNRILSLSLSGEYCQQLKRTRDCKEPILDKALLKWHRSIEALKEGPISISNALLTDKVKEFSLAMGKTYFPSMNWILRWKYRHDIRCKAGRIDTKEALDELDSKIDMAEIISSVEGQMLDPEAFAEAVIKEDQQDICEHCGVIISRKRGKRRNPHLRSCPDNKSVRHELTLGEKVKVLKALEKPGTKKIALARKFGVSSSSISRLYKNRAVILSRRAAAHVNVKRKRDRTSNEPELEQRLCEWYAQQLEYGYHLSGPIIREKACEIAISMGKDFRPSESWVHRFKQRYNVRVFDGVEEIDDYEEEENTEEVTTEEVSETAEGSKEFNQEGATADEDKKKKRRRKKGKNQGEEEVERKPRPIVPRFVMCEKCGCVTQPGKKNRIYSLKHEKGCPDLRPRNEVTYEVRLEMLKALEVPGTTVCSVAKRFGVSTSSMSRMKNRKETILRRSVGCSKLKRIRDCKEPEIAKRLYDWYIEKRNEGPPPIGRKIKEKAAEFAREEGREFKVSSGWLGRWKHRYNLIGTLPPRVSNKVKNPNNVPSLHKKRSVGRKKMKASVKYNETNDVQEEEADFSMRDNHISNDEPFVVSHMADSSQPVQSSRMFLNQRYQNPWNVGHLPVPVSSTPSIAHNRPNPNHGLPDESHVPYSYDPMARHMFHNVFENFASAAATTNHYSMAMVENGVPMRDYLQQPDNNCDIHQPSSSAHHPIIPHQATPLSLQTTVTGISRPYHTNTNIGNMNISQDPLPLIQQSPVVTNSPAPIMTPVNEEDSGQQQQIMDAFKLMNTFLAKEKIGENVQAALKTIEMSLKGGTKRDGHGHSSRNSYPHM